MRTYRKNTLGHGDFHQIIRKSNFVRESGEMGTSFLARMVVFAFSLLFIPSIASADRVRIIMPETESGSISVPLVGKSFKIMPGKVLQKESVGKANHHLESTIQKILSRLTSQEMDEVNWLDKNSGDSSQKRLVSGSASTAVADHLHDPALATRIITIPMSAVPPRLQQPGSSKGMPPKMRIVEIDRSQRYLPNTVFRRGLHESNTLPLRCG